VVVNFDLPLTLMNAKDFSFLFVLTQIESKPKNMDFSLRSKLLKAFFFHVESSVLKLLRFSSF
jgi:hypothetical protein